MQSDFCNLQEALNLATHPSYSSFSWPKIHTIYLPFYFQNSSAFMKEIGGLEVISACLLLPID
jgi:hypothetical protein